MHARSRSRRALARQARSTSPLDAPARQARLPARLLQVAKEIEEVVRKAKKIGASFINGPMVKALNAWVEMAADRKRMMNALRGGANTFLSRKIRAALNSWEAMVAEKAEEMAGLQAAGTRWLNRALAQAWPTFVALGEARRKAKRAASYFLHRPVIKCLDAWRTRWWRGPCPRTAAHCHEEQ